MITSVKLRQLPVDWWIIWRDEDPVRNALAIAQKEYWVEQIQQSLIKNSADGGRPATWAAIADSIRRDVANIKRWKSGKQTRYSPLDFLALAGSAGLNARELFPSNCEWVTAAVQHLTGDSVSRAEACVFATFCVITPPGELSPFQNIDSAAIREHLPPDVWLDEADIERNIHKTHDAVFFALRELISKVEQDLELSTTS